jgi:alpha-tubulin suppressor-like RCC1 family protein
MNRLLTLLSFSAALACGEESKTEGETNISPADTENSNNDVEDTGSTPDTDTGMDTDTSTDTNTDTDTDTGPDGLPINIQVIVEVVAGGYHTCVRFDDNTLDCWGDNTYAQSNPPTGEYIQLTAGEYHTCAITVDGDVACWGDNSDGQSVTQEGDFIEVSAGRTHTCGIESDNSVLCWNESESVEATPTDGFLTVSAGWQNTCGIKTDNMFACWGRDSDHLSDLQSGPANPILDIVVLLNDVYQYSNYVPCACSVDSVGEIECWGGFGGADGCPTSIQDNIPGGNWTTSEFIQIEAGNAHVCALDVTGVAHCWGSDDSEEIEAPFGTHNFTSIAVGYDHNCGLRGNGELVCWGDNSSYQLGSYGWSAE